MKWLIIGTGKISQDFIQALKRNKEEVYFVLSRDEKRAKEFSDINKISHYGTNLKKALEEVDAVYVATPNSTHFDFAKKAIKAKKHVVVEKPMTHSFRLTKKLFDLADKYEVKLMEAYAHITWPEFHKLINKGSHLRANLEKVSSKIKSNTYKEASSFSKKLFGGVLPDLGVYPIALSILIYGKVKNAEISNVTFLNNVEVECDVRFEHIGGQITEFFISKTKDGDNDVYIDNKKVGRHTAGNYIKNRMDNEVKVFVNNENLDLYKSISIETARVVKLLKKQARKI